MIWTKHQPDDKIRTNQTIHTLHMQHSIKNDIQGDVIRFFCCWNMYQRYNGYFGLKFSNIHEFLMRCMCVRAFETIVSSSAFIAHIQMGFVLGSYIRGEENTMTHMPKPRKIHISFVNWQRTTTIAFSEYVVCSNERKRTACHKTPTFSIIMHVLVILFACIVHRTTVGPHFHLIKTITLQ